MLQLLRDVLGVIADLVSIATLIVAVSVRSKVKRLKDDVFLTRRVPILIEELQLHYRKAFELRPDVERTQDAQIDFKEHILDASSVLKQLASHLPRSEAADLLVAAKKLTAMTRQGRLFGNPSTREISKDIAKECCLELSLGISAIRRKYEDRQEEPNSND